MYGHDPYDGRRVPELEEEIRRLKADRARLHNESEQRLTRVHELEAERESLKTRAAEFERLLRDCVRPRMPSSLEAAMTDEWVFSRDGERFDSPELSSPDRAFAEWVALECPKPGYRVHIGRVVSRSAGEFIGDMLERLNECAYEDAGAAADGWPDATLEQEEDLEAMVVDAVNAWADKHGLQPKFFTVEDIEVRTYEPEKSDV